MISGQNTILNNFVPTFAINNIIGGQTLVYDPIRQAFVNSFQGGNNRMKSFITVNQTLVRPANTTAYAAFSVISNSTTTPIVITFPYTVSYPGGSGIISYSALSTNQVTNRGGYSLFLFNEPPTPINDGSPFAIMWAYNSTLIGAIQYYLGTEFNGDSSPGDCAYSIDRFEYRKPALASYHLTVLVDRKPFMEYSWVVASPQTAVRVSLCL